MGKPLADFMFGERYSGPHDFVSLRRRYAHHKGSYGWSRCYRIGRLVLVIERNRWLARGWRVGVKSEGQTVRPYWDRSDRRWPFAWQQ